MSILFVCATPGVLVAGGFFDYISWHAICTCFAWFKGTISSFSFSRGGGTTTAVDAPKNIEIPNPQNLAQRYPELPQWEDWLKRCENVTPYDDLVKKYNIEISGESDFTTNDETFKAMCHDAREVSQVTREEVKTVIDIFCAQMTKKGRLFDSNTWVDQKAITDRDLLTGKLRPFVIGLKVPPGTECILVSDLHGAVRPLVPYIREFIKNPQRYFIFCGDYVDRGIYGIETLLTILQLKLWYPSKVILVRGNHEDLGLPGNKKCFQQELKYKFGEDINELKDTIAKVYNIMPLAAFIGCGSKPTRYMAALHAVPDMRFSPKALFKALDGQKEGVLLHHFYPINIPSRNPENTHVCDEFKKERDTNNKYINEWDTVLGARNISRCDAIDFLHGHILHQKKEEQELFLSRGGGCNRMYGKRLVHAIFDDWRLKPSFFARMLDWNATIAELHCVFRGHQHRDSHDFHGNSKGERDMSMMQALWRDHGVTQAWNYEKYKDNQLPPQTLYTLLPPPDNAYGSPSRDKKFGDKDYYPGYNFASVALVTTSNAKDNWTLKRITSPAIALENNDMMTAPDTLSDLAKVD
jgi:hypothetical protein